MEQPNNDAFIALSKSLNRVINEQATELREEAARQVQLKRKSNAQEHSEGIDGQSIEKQQDVQQTRSGSHTSLHDSENC
jgi:hypothetical protein